MAANSSLTPERIQAHMRAVARGQYEAETIPPFTAYFHPTDPLPYLNYAIPDEPPGDAASLAAPLALLRNAFRNRGRQPRFEFVEAVYPRLEATLAASGFSIEARPQLMVATPANRQAVPAVPGLTVQTLSRESSLASFVELLRVQRRAFGMGDSAAVTEKDAAWMRDGLAQGGCLVGRLGEEAVGIATFLDPRDGLTELAGIGTLEAHRRKGIGAALTAAALDAAFAAGASAAFLSAADARAGRVYEGAGFAAFGNVVFATAPGS